MVFKDKLKYTSGGRDSLVKIIDVYFSSVTSVPFTFQGKEYFPRDIKVSSNLLKGFSCLENCGACCRDFTLDFIANEPHPYELQNREVLFNGRPLKIYSDLNDENKTDKHGKIRCKHLNIENGRCGIHMKHPLSCDFELLRFLTFKDPMPNRLSHQLFGRGWNMQRIDGERGALCSMKERTEEDRLDTLRKLNRLKQWTDYFSLDTVLPSIIEWVRILPLDSDETLYIQHNCNNLDRFLEVK